MDKIAGQLGLVVESIPTGLVVVNASGEVVLFNRQAEQMFGYSREEVIGEKMEVLLPSRFREHHPKLRDGYFDSSEARPMGEGRDLFARRKDGSEFPVEVGLNPIETDDGSFVIGAIADITARKHSERLMKTYARELERSNEELERFASVASHDLQEPLRKITTFGERLNERYLDQLEPKARDYVMRMIAAAGRMQVLISDLLSFSRVKSGAQPFVKTDLAFLVKDAAADLDVALEEARGKIVLGPLPSVYCDAPQMRQVFFNLFSNAIKFRTEERSPELEVAATSSVAVDGTRNWEVTVADNGIGINPAHAEKIFEIFHRLHGRSEYEGTGVGLAICRKIVERHGGSITAIPNSPHGSVFVLTLPEEPTANLSDAVS